MKKILILSILFITSIMDLYCIEDYKIDWINSKIFSSASTSVKNDYNYAANRLNAMDAIHEKAKANFVKVLKKINIYESLSIFDYFEERSEKNRDMYSLIDKAILHNIEYPDLNTIKITYSIDIYGDNSLIGIVMDERGSFTEELIGYMDYHYNTKYTGVIIDARGDLFSYDGYLVKVKPCIFITVKDSDGRIIFNKNNIFPEVIRKKGMVKYSYDINGDHSSTAGEKPLKLVASGTGDRAGSVIVISMGNAKKMLSGEFTRKSIQQGNVVIVIDR